MGPDIFIALVDSIAAQLRWVLFIGESAEILPDYLEIAADQQACRNVNTDRGRWSSCQYVSAFASDSQVFLLGVLCNRPATGCSLP
ncbi:tudor domain-containing protein [Corynebacterium suranareeae]|uniref:hypothetical protein n=1 Tax=Corynebacterium suranareeae TaxID=2506452 RepID=UPI001E40E73F|nr:hypothetical protein [Corynebacterium suranareeae]